MVPEDNIYQHFRLANTPRFKQAEASLNKSLTRILVERRQPLWYGLVACKIDSPVKLTFGYEGKSTAFLTLHAMQRGWSSLPPLRDPKRWVLCSLYSEWKGPMKVVAYFGMTKVQDKQSLLSSGTLEQSLLSEDCHYSNKYRLGRILNQIIQQTTRLRARF